MIHHEHQFVFVHVNKTGGTSIEQAFGYTGEKHEHCDWYKEELTADQWRSYFKFAVVRNPYARLVSMYHFRVKLDIRVHGRSFPEWLPTVEAEDRAMHPTDSRADQRQRLMLAPMLHWIRSSSGEVELDHVARLETIERDWAYICQRIGADVALPHANRTRHEHYSRYYDEGSRAFIAERYAEDLEAFGYEFEDA